MKVCEIRRLHYARPLGIVVYRLANTKYTASCIKMFMKAYRRTSRGCWYLQYLYTCWSHSYNQEAKIDRTVEIELLALQINTFIQSASKMLQQTSGVSSPHQNKENRFMWIYVRKHLAFEVQPNSVLTSVLQIFMCGVTKKPLVYSVPIENEETLHKHVFDACQTIGNRPATFQRGWQSMVRRVHDSDAGNFERLL